MRGGSLVVGASGFIGQTLWHKLPPDLRHGTYCSYALPELVPLDLRNAEETSQLVRRLSPSIIFQPAAFLNADACEERPEECWAINVEGTRNLARAAREVGAKFVYFSSDYVFDGKAGPYGEDDKPSPINVYGKAKLAAEESIQEILADYLIVRGNVVYGWEPRGKNFVMGLINRLSQGQTMRVPIDQVGSPTYADNMVDAVLELAGSDHSGIYHVAGSEVMDRHKFACIAADVFDLDKSLCLPVSTPELGQRALRPLKAGLCINRVQPLLSTRLLDPGEGLRQMKDQGNGFVAGSHTMNGQNRIQIAGPTT